MLTSGALLAVTVALSPAATGAAQVIDAPPTPTPFAGQADPPLSDQARDDDAVRIASTHPPVKEFAASWPTVGQITTYFGEIGPASPRGHSGLDIAAPEGTPIQAADDGEVLKAYWSNDGYGGLIVIGHPTGYETWYAHLDRLDVDKGDQVKRGQQIALMGSTGFSSGPHLHFEIRQEGQICDPLDFLDKAALKAAR